MIYTEHATFEDLLRRRKLRTIHENTLHKLLQAFSGEVSDRTCTRPHTRKSV